MKSLAALFVLAACGRADPATDVERDVPVGVSIACAPHGAAAFANDCTVQRTTRDGRVVLTLIAPDGGFRRLEAGANGDGIDTADGAAGARVSVAASGEIAIQVDDDRYRLPATAR